MSGSLQEPHRSKPFNHQNIHVCKSYHMSYKLEKPHVSLWIYDSYYKQCKHIDNDGEHLQ